MKRVSLFFNGSAASRSRLNALRTRLDGAYELGEPAEWSSKEFTRSCWCDFATVVDATIEPAPRNVYEIMTSSMVSPTVLLIADSHVPVNVYYAATGGTPTYPYPHVFGDLPREPWNDGIWLTWLQERLHALEKMPERPCKTEADYARFSKMSPSLLRAAGASALRQPDGADGVFLSYRGRYFNEASELARQISAGAFGLPPMTVRLVRPGKYALDGEFLSEARMWMVLGALATEIRSCSEFWVYHDSAWDHSWWTVGELLIKSYLEQVASLHIRVRIYDPATGELRDPEPGFGFQGSADDLAPLHMLMNYSNVGGVAQPEAVRVMRLLRWVCRLRLDGLLRRLVLPALERLRDSDAPQLGPEAGRQIFVEKVKTALADPGAIRRIAFHPSHDRSYWTTLVSDPQNRAYSFDVQEFVAAPRRRMARRPASVFQRDATTRAPSRYLWHPPLTSKGPFSSVGKLIEVPTYVRR